MESDANELASANLTSFDVMRYLRMFWRRKWIILGVTALVVGATTVYTLRQPKVYSASASVIIDVTAPRFLDNEVKEVMGEERSSYWFNKEYYETQNKVILSRSVASRVVEKLGLQNDAAFLGLERIKDDAERAKVMAGVDAALLLQSKIKVVPIKDSRIVSIVVEDLDAKRAALLANEVAEAYMAENLGLKLRVTENASRWLEERLSELESRSKVSEMAVYDFKKDADILSTSLENRLSIVSDRLGSYNSALTEVRTRMASLQARSESMLQLREKAKGDDTWAEGLVTDDKTVQSLKEAYVQQRAACAELAERYLAEHPKLMECNAKLASSRDDFVRELNNIVTRSETQLTEARANERNLVKLVGAAKAEAFDVNKKQIEYDRLKRDADNNQRLYDVVLKRLKDIELSGLLRTSNVRVLDPARPQFAPVRPNVQNAVLLAIILGIMAGVGVTLFMNFLENSVTSQQDIEERLGLAFLGLMPIMEPNIEAQGRDLVVHRHPKSSFAECCRAIRTNLLFMSPDRPLRSMLVTSCGPKEGKSTSAISLGIAMAQSGSRVLLLDTDMRRPRLHRAFGTPNDIGISSLVVGEGKLEDAVKATDVPNLFLLPCGPIPPNPAELFHTNAFRDLLAKVCERYDRVILDSPPVNAVADAVVLATQVDGVVFVLKAASTHREFARRAVRALIDVNAKVLGGVLNSVNFNDPKYGGYYEAYRQYGYYYGEKKDEVLS